MNSSEPTLPSAATPRPNAEPEVLPLSLLNDLVFCPRRAALKLVEGWREANQHTERGDIVHEHADLAGYEVAKGIRLWRAVPIWSDRLGLSGKCDVVEVHPLAPEPAQAGPPIGCLYPVEFKLGKRRRFENDDVQVCAQALCLEEMFRIPVPSGAIFHADSKRRRHVQFTPELRARTEQAVAELHRLVQEQTLPPAAPKPACAECSLVEVCLPSAVACPHRSSRLTAELFKT